MRARRASSLRFRLVALGALLALAATYLTPIVNSDWNAWRYDHGHAALGAVGEHSHPWDEDETTAGEATGQEVVYTTSADGVPGLTAIWSIGLLAITVVMSSLLVREVVVRLPREAAHPPLPQPPNGSFSPA